MRQEVLAVLIVARRMVLAPSLDEHGILLVILSGQGVALYRRS